MKIICTNTPDNSMFTAGKTYEANLDGPFWVVTDNLGHLRYIPKISMRFIVKNEIEPLYAFFGYKEKPLDNNH